MENQRRWVCEWIWLREQWTSDFSDLTSLCLQVSSVRCSWWSLGESQWSLGGLWDSPLWPLNSPSVAVICPGSPRLHRSSRSETQSLIVMAVAQTMPTLWKAKSPSAETPPRMSSFCKWTAWVPRTWSCITEQDTLWGKGSVSPDTNPPPGNKWADLQGELRHIQYRVDPRSICCRLRSVFLEGVRLTHHTAGNLYIVSLREPPFLLDSLLAS